MKRKLSILLVVIMVFSLSTVSVAYSRYEVQQGDTLNMIAEKHGVSLEDILDQNEIDNPDMIFPGQIIQIGEMTQEQTEEQAQEQTQQQTQEYTRKDLNEQYVMALAWIQNSGEFVALSHQAFNVAKEELDEDMAYNESEKDRAIVVDCDETVIDNSAFNAAFTGNEGSYGSELWAEWVNDAEALAMPGAVEFLNYADEQGVDIYYVTNRENEYNLKLPTMKNLNDLGFPQVTEDHVLLRPADGSDGDKVERRAMIEEDHRIVLLMGDNLNDFDAVFAEAEGNEGRVEAVHENEEMFGDKFIMLPNPIYGEWEPNLSEEFYWGLSAKEKSEARKNSLRMWGGYTPEN